MGDLKVVKDLEDNKILKWYTRDNPIRVCNSLFLYPFISITNLLHSFILIKILIIYFFFFLIKIWHIIIFIIEKWIRMYALSYLTKKKFWYIRQCQYIYHTLCTIKDLFIPLCTIKDSSLPIYHTIWLLINIEQPSLAIGLDAIWHAPNSLYLGSCLAPCKLETTHKICCRANWVF